MSVQQRNAAEDDLPIVVGTTLIVLVLWAVTAMML